MCFIKKEASCFSLSKNGHAKYDTIEKNGHAKYNTMETYATNF